MSVHADSFLTDRLMAVQRFAQTMIVVDDEADLTVPAEQVPDNVVRPSRRQSRAARDEIEQMGRVVNQKDTDRTHILDGKVLVDSALKHGLVCSVLRPGPTENIVDTVVQAAQRVDIICLDWKMHDDDGNTTVSLIKEIVKADQLGEGRLRLIVIYTAEHGRARILNKIKSEISSSVSKEVRSRMHLQTVGDREIQSNVGLKIVYLVKAHNDRIPKRLKQDRVSERNLPEQALREFASLCEGLLANVALGTVAAVRDAAHQIVGSFSGDMDGPYFHHRATIRNPDEAEDYAINTVLSGFRAAVRLQEVGRTFAGREAVERRLREMAKGDTNFRLSFIRNGEETVEFTIDDVVRLIRDGVKGAYASIPGNKPGKDHANQALTSLFAGSVENTLAVMRRFAALTSIGSHPGTLGVRTGEYVPSLGLGTVVMDNGGRYWLCIQASCDSVRVEKPQPFLFVPLVEVLDKGEHVVPRQRNGGQIEHVALSLEDLGYAKGRSIEFSPDPNTERVLAEKRGRPRKLRFKSTNGNTFEWVADLKHYQALNVAQKLGQEMGRLGFDEFEPFRVSKR